MPRNGPFRAAAVVAGVAAAAAFGLRSDAAPAGERTLDGGPPLVIAHRGASGLLPEHTLEAYRLAIEQGADFIEPDLVATKDGVLIARHEPMLGATTDVAERPEFAGRRTTRLLGLAPVTDWFASDFTLAEIKALRAKQPVGSRDQSWNGRFSIPTLEEIVALAKAESARTGRTVGIYPELKHPAFHAALRLPLEGRLLAVLEGAGWTESTAPVIVQSFEPESLRALRTRTRLRLVQLVGGRDVDLDGNVVPPLADRLRGLLPGAAGRSPKDLVTPEGLAEIRACADGVAPWKPYVLPTKAVDRDRDGKPDDLDRDGRIDARDRVLGSPTGLVADAHAAGLFVHVWTFRDDAESLASTFGGDPAAEYRAFYALGVDGVFSDDPGTAVRARDARGP